MDTSHQTLLPIIARHLDDGFSVPRTYLEAKASTGETADTLSFVERPVLGLAEDFDLYPGQSILGELKTSVSDLRADEKKPWRAPHKRALGDYRIFWLLKDGDVRPEHVDDGTGWGVAIFDDTAFQIVRPPQLFHNVNFWAQTALLMKLMGKPVLDNPADAALSSRVRAAKRYAVNKTVKDAEALVKDGPMTTGQIKRMTDWKGSASKLADLLAQSDKLTAPDVPGGNWTYAGDAVCGTES